METYNDNPELAQDKSDLLLQNMLDLKDSMIENIDNLIQRDGKIEIIAEKAKSLSLVSNSYKQRSKKLKEQERRKRYMYYAGVIFALLLVLFILYAVFIGFGHSSPKKEEA